MFLPREVHGQKSLVGYSQWGRKRVRYDLVTKQQELLSNLQDVVGGSSLGLPQ